MELEVRILVRGRPGLKPRSELENALGLKHFVTGWTRTLATPNMIHDTPILLQRLEVGTGHTEDHFK